MCSVEPGSAGLVIFLQVMKVRSDTFCDTFIQKIIERWTLKNYIFANFDEARKLCKASNDAYDCEGWLILQDLLNERVAEGVTFDPYDFTFQL